MDDRTLSRVREARNGHYQEYLRTEAIEIDGVVDTLAELSKYVRMAIVTTAKRAASVVDGHGAHGADSRRAANTDSSAARRRRYGHPVVSVPASLSRSKAEAHRFAKS
ncbi:HAD family hydrolase [Streptomyces doebereineriae]|uniref:Uncharacterized protein n=1 Tax=Streptomyces doebereineriae TaxID=3075528 RepID=A0ABU2VGF5_9ACTN|nr:hypothetical protein [Streptomyces sp. DSM 41640]MDT0484652.1 hypothetical protein [Streptomyces sp. DSM 41640]